MYIRISEKVILHKWLDYSQRMQHLLVDGITQKALDKLAEKHFDVEEIAFKQYYSSALVPLIHTKLE